MTIASGVRLWGLLPPETIQTAESFLYSSEAARSSLSFSSGEGASLRTPPPKTNRTTGSFAGGGESGCSAAR